MTHETLAQKQYRLAHQEISKRIATKLREIVPQGQGFILITFDYESGGTMSYMSTGERTTSILLLKELVSRMEQDQG